ncbi:hypothetical protein [Aquifex aeolicus]|uniref:Uncharacterized protein aq_711 n=1 Tax=Aquifex aeolicus (strain VF5) TaxID=224324 RepID=Y711_AQUAE|nr:hypothetical protein [Aquifex aeolicus]O66927.1 RecName: Full=Uncharacterized protein aq_711; Flags: Precursor [Aquifex aeolicus VF5]AAC06889.1 putative protein [Aquifex aeolicus VF5]
MRDFYLFLGAVFLLVLGVWAYNAYKEHKINSFKEISYKVYLFEKGKLKKEEILKITKGTPFYPYVLAKFGNFQEIYEDIEEENMKKFYKERLSADFYLNKKYGKALENLKEIKKEDFNYPSAKSLEAFSYEKLGKINKALSLWSAIKEEYPNTYFGNLSQVKIFLLKEKER